MAGNADGAADRGVTALTADTRVSPDLKHGRLSLPEVLAQSVANMAPSAAMALLPLLVFAGAGRAFSSGDDIGEGMGTRQRGGDPEGINADRGLHYQLVKQLLEMPKPVVSAIHGRCHGAAWVLALRRRAGILSEVS